MTYQQMNLFYYLTFIPMIIGFILMIAIMIFIEKIYSSNKKGNDAQPNEERSTIKGNCPC